MGALEYEVVWPLHRRHYLSPELNDEEPVTVNTSVSADDGLPPGRVLAARALLAAACSQKRVGALLGVSRRRVGRRTGDVVAVSAALRDPAALILARTTLADSANCGSTAEERATATAWLEAAWLEEETQHPAPLEDVSPPLSAPARNGGAATLPAPRSPRRQTAVGSNGNHGRSRASAARVRSTPHAAASRSTGLGPEQVRALSQQHARILHRSLVLGCAVKTEMKDLVTLRAALADLLEDITEAARRIGVILQPLAKGA